MQKQLNRIQLKFLEKIFNYPIESSTYKPS